MHSKKEIRKAFELVGLSSPKERKHFEKMRIFETESQPAESYLFIRSSSNSSGLELEKEDAKLERDS